MAVKLNPPRRPADVLVGSYLTDGYRLLQIEPFDENNVICLEDCKTGEYSFLSYEEFARARFKSVRLGKKAGG